MSAIDSMMVENATNTTNPSDKDVEQKYFIDCVDEQGGAFQNSEVVIVTNNLRGTANPASLAETSFQFPMTIDLEYDLKMFSELPLAFKNSVLDLLYSYEFKINGDTIIERTDLSNVINTWKLVALNSPNDEFIRDELMFSKNDCTIFYNEASSISGQGECNNTVGLRKPTLDTRLETLHLDDTSNNKVNKGFVKRAQLMSERADGYMSEDKYGYIRKSYLQIDTARKKFTYNLWVTIPLRYLSPFFQKCPLLRGCKLSCSFNINTVQSMIVPHAHTKYSATHVGIGKMAQPTSNITSRNFNPFQLGSDLAQVVDGTEVDKNDATIRLSSRIGGQFGSKCYIHACLYKLSPEFESEYFSKPPQTVTYDVVKMQHFPKVTKNININIDSNAKYLKYVVIQTLVTRGKNGNGTALDDNDIIGGESTLLSPFTSSNCTKGQFYNTQIKLGGKNYFEHPITYDYEVYTEQYNNIMINGGITSFGSTQLSKDDYMKNGYGYLLYDLSRLKSTTEWSTGQNLEFVATFLGNHADIDLNVFYVSETSVTIDLQTSDIIKNI